MVRGDSPFVYHSSRAPLAQLSLPALSQKPGNLGLFSICAGRSFPRKIIWAGPPWCATRGGELSLRTDGRHIIPLKTAPQRRGTTGSQCTERPPSFTKKRIRHGWCAAFRWATT